MEARDVKARSGHRSPGFFLLALIMVALCQASAQPGIRIRSLAFEGVTALSVNELRENFLTKEGQGLSRSLLNSDVRNLIARYNAEGYVFCSAEPVVKYDDDSSSAAVTLFVKEGNPVVIGSVEVIANPPMVVSPEDGPAGLNRGDVFHPGMVEQGIERMLRGLEKRGYPFARATVDRIEFVSGTAVDSATIVFSIDPGPRTMVTEFQVEGNTTTDKSVIVREARLAENQPFSDETAKLVKRRLDRLRLFSSVSLPELFITEQQRGGILLRVKEGNPNRFDGVLGYVPSTGKQKGFVTGLVDVEFRNLFGTARSFSARWIRENQTTQDLMVRYREPWVASIPLDAQLGFSQRKQDSTYLRRSYEIEATYSILDDFSVGFSFHQSSVFPSERINNPVAGSETSILGGSVWYDNRDNPMNPTEGVSYRSSYEAGNKSFSNGGSARLTRVTFDLEYHFSPVVRQVLALALHGRDVASNILEQSDLIQIGGTSTLRGYRESQFLCARVAWMNIEYRFLSGQRSQLFGFLDGAYLALQDRPSAGLIGSEQSKLGYGFGARIDSGFGVIGFSIGLGEGDTFRTAKLHLRLINEF